MQRVYRRLGRFYLPTLLGNKRNPLNELAYVMLSGQTVERSYQRSYLDFKRRFPKWELLLEAHLRDIEMSIWHAGLARQKARYIREIALRLRLDFGEVSLRALKGMADTFAEDYLMSLPGVGVKIARCVLMYSLGRRVFPADVHCLRIMRRLGWITSVDRSSRRVADQAQAIVPSPIRKRLHILFVQHGRRMCRPKPNCTGCCIVDECPYGA